MQTWPKIHTFPEFPTGNGKIDLIIKTIENTYGLELKSFKSFTETRNSVVQAAEYGKSLDLTIMYLIIFIEFEIPEDKKESMFKHVIDEKTCVEVIPLYINY